MAAIAPQGRQSARRRRARLRRRMGAYPEERARRQGFSRATAVASTAPGDRRTVLPGEEHAERRHRASPRPLFLRGRGGQCRASPAASSSSNRRDRQGACFEQLDRRCAAEAANAVPEDRRGRVQVKDKRGPRARRRWPRRVQWPRGAVAQSQGAAAALVETLDLAPSSIASVGVGHERGFRPSSYLMVVRP
jgi:hypothetical protein